MISPTFTDMRVARRSMSQSDSDELTDVEKAHRAQALVKDIDPSRSGLRDRALDILDDLTVDVENAVEDT